MPLIYIYICRIFGDMCFKKSFTGCILPSLVIKTVIIQGWVLLSIDCAYLWLAFTPQLNPTLDFSSTP
jgi:hypothetical protein